MTIVLTLIFLIIAALVAIALHYLVGERRGQVTHTYHGEVALQAARSAARAAMRLYADRLSDPGDPLYRALLEADGQLGLPPLEPACHKGLADLAGDFPGLALRTGGVLGAFAPVGGELPDPAEKRGLLTVSAEATWRGVRRRVEIRAPFVFAQAAPRAVSRFTLFVRSAGGTDFNVLDGDSHGVPERGRPLVVVNGPGADCFENGWIYLGGGRVNLNLARGGTNFGEDFHLPDTVSRSVFFPNQSYALLNMNVGFSTSGAKEPVYGAFPAKDAFKSSALRLFGCPGAVERPTPTVVFGDVWRRYLQAAAIGPVREGLLGKVVVMPWTLTGREIPREAGFPPFLMLSTTMYQIYMSQVREEPYNRSYDMLLAGSERPPPLLLKGALAGRLPTPYPLTDPPVEIRAGDKLLLHSGSLRTLSVDGALRDRTGAVYGGWSDLVDRAGRRDGAETVIDLQGIVRVGGVRPDLSRSPLRLRGRGTLVFDGGVTLGDVRLADGTRDLVTVVAASGDIRLRGRNVTAGLVALKGTVYSDAGTEVSGFVACDRLDPAKLLRGGTLAYDPRFNPEVGGNYPRGYAFSCAPDPVAVLEE